MPTIVNKGTVGSAIDITTTGLVRVEGPALWFNGVASVAAAAPNRLRRDTVHQFAVDAPFDIRVDTHININPLGTSRLTDGGLYMQVGSTGTHTITFHAEDASFPALSVSLAAIQALVPGVVAGSRLQVRYLWTPATDTLSFHVRPPGLPLSDDTGWLAGPTVVHAGKAVRSSSGSNFVLNNLNGASYAWHEPVYALRITSGPAVYADISPEVLARTPANAASVVDGYGTWAVLKDVAGPQTMIIPKGVAWINPQTATSASFEADTPDNAAYDVLSTEDCILMVALTSTLVATGVRQAATKQSGAPGIWFDTSSGKFVGSSNAAAVTTTYNSNTDIPPNKPIVLAFVIDRALGRGFSYIFDRNGRVQPATLPYLGTVAPATDIAPSGGMAFFNVSGTAAVMQGALHSVFFKKGVGIALTATELEGAARALLAPLYRAPTFTRASLPAGQTPVKGDRFQALNDHTAYFDGYKWQPDQPGTVDNIAYLIANNHLLYGGPE